MSVGLIIPDVHEQAVKLQRVLKKYDYVDWVKFEGDFMDSYDGLTWQTFEMVRWLADNVQNPKYEFVWGNHDLHYAFPIEGVMCSGFDRNKLKIVQAHLNDKDHWQRFKLMTWIDEEETPGNSSEPRKWLLSHGGLHPFLLNPFKGFEKGALQEMEEEAMWKLRYCQEVTAPIAAGRGRGGVARVGGVDWLDWESEFTPIAGLNQIVGHSFGKKIRYKHQDGSHNYCIDTHFRHVVLVEDGKIKIEEAI